MKMIPVSPRLAVGLVASSFVLAAAVGCSHLQRETDPDKRPIPPASIGVASSGIGSSGGDSADTRAVGTVATGEGNGGGVGTGVIPVTATPHPYRSGQGDVQVLPNRP